MAAGFHWERKLRYSRTKKEEKFNYAIFIHVFLTLRFNATQEVVLQTSGVSEDL